MTAAAAKGGWFSLASSAATAVVVGFASTILLIMEAARAVGATPAQQASWAAAVCFGMAITSLLLSWAYRMPIITAWSTPGAALIATSALGVSFANALGAFVAAGLLMCVAALLRPLARAIERIPGPIAAAMLAGVLLSYVMRVPAAAVALPWIVLPLAVVFFALRLRLPLYAVPAIVALGIAAAAATGGVTADWRGQGVSWLVWTTPAFDIQAIVSLGLPLFLVTMASQNLPGFAVLKAAGYTPPVMPALIVTGAGSVLLAPFGSHAINMAAITASIVTGPDCHPDPAKRWLMSIPYFVFYVIVGLLASVFIAILGALPPALVTAIAGLALFGPLFGAITAMFKAPDEIESALLTFLVTASGVAIAGVGAPFWGLLAGLALHAARHALSRT
jgi:benzoate membrane transport protein